MEITAAQFVGFCVLLLLGVVMISNVVTSSNTDQLNNYTLNFTENPNDGDILVLDGQNFEFDNNNVNSVNSIPVVIDSDVNNTISNLRVAVTNNTNLVIQS